MVHGFVIRSQTRYTLLMEPMSFSNMRRDKPESGLVKEEKCVPEDGRYYIEGGV